MARDETIEFASDVQRLLFNLVRNYEQCDRTCLAQYGVTAAQGYTILTFPEENSVNMNTLSESMGLANSTMTRMVDQLVEKDLVQRRPGDEDRREVLVGLTGEGRRLHRNLAQARRDALGLVLVDIPREEHRDIVSVLNRLNKALKAATGGCCGS